MGKGSRPRPYSVDHKTFEGNWELAFGKTKVEDNDVETKKEKSGVIEEGHEGSEQD